MSLVKRRCEWKKVEGVQLMKTELENNIECGKKNTPHPTKLKDHV